ncbi:MAG: hypothetical protein ACP5IT_06280 [Thermoproteota archaeon]|jgi:hypothetical protein
MNVSTNVFPVFIDGSLNLLEDDRRRHPSLEDLRNRFPCNFYAEGDKVYAYGKNSYELEKIGFSTVFKAPRKFLKLRVELYWRGSVIDFSL